jgi:hypothetical protein
MIKSLLYISSPSQYLKSEEIHRILEHAQVKNGENNITGFLLYNNNLFVQLLEGTDADIKETYERISNDLRHTHLIVLSNAISDNRSFDGYYSGFNVFNSVDVLNDFKEYIGEVSALSVERNSDIFKIIEGITKHM